MGGDSDDNIGIGEEIKCGSNDGRRDEVDGLFVEVVVNLVVILVGTVVVTGACVVVGDWE